MSTCGVSSGASAARRAALTAADLIAERYDGIRPAPGYGCQPDHTEKGTIFALLAAPESAGIQLTESYAMMPGSSVSGVYFAHPQARYFGVGRIGSDQLEDYAARKGWEPDEARRWLSTLIDDEPAAADLAARPGRRLISRRPPADLAPAAD